MPDSDHFRLRTEQLLILRKQQLALVVHRRHAQLRALLRAQHLPRHDVRVMLHRGDQHFIAGADIRLPVRLRYEVERLRRPAREDDLARPRRVHKRPHRLARLLELLGRNLRQVMYATVNIRVLALVIPHQRVDHRPRFLRSRRIVQIHQRMPVHLRLQNRKILPNPLHVERPVGSFPTNWHSGCSAHRTSSTTLPVTLSVTRSPELTGTMPSVNSKCSLTRCWI